ncbi:MAG: lipid A biosynthesis acyltransferase, partial [Cyclobacteriaceae bacterium]
MFLLRALSRLPFPVLFLLSDLLFFLAYHIVRYRRWVVYRNIHNSFPDMSESEMLKIERVFYRNLCDYIVETLKLLTITPEELKRRMFYKNPEVIQQCKDENTSALFLASHQFNWEWMIAAANLWLPVAVDFV